MKEILFVLAIFAMGACNNNASHTEKTVDSSYKVTIDSLKNNTDHLASPSDSVAGSDADSAKATIDSVKKKL